AALVWKNCDGHRTVEELRELMEDNSGSPVPEEMDWLALDQLETFGLLDEAALRPSQFAGMNRRDMGRRVGMAAIALPVILSIVAPTAQAQAAGLPPNSCCNNPGQCASGSCAQNPICASNPSTKACS